MLGDFIMSCYEEVKGKEKERIMYSNKKYDKF